MKCETVKIKADNDQGFSVCNADAIPEGAVLFTDKKKPGRKPKVD